MVDEYNQSAFSKLKLRNYDAPLHKSRSANKTTIVHETIVHVSYYISQALITRIIKTAVALCNTKNN